MRPPTFTSWTWCGAIAALLVAGALLGARPATAQQTEAAQAQEEAATRKAKPSQGGRIEEITVTGTKRAQAQQDTPIAISTLTQKQLEQTFLTDVRAVSDLAPNLVIESLVAFNAAAPGIRGTGTSMILTTQDTSVGFLIDNFALSHVQSQMLELFDTQQVEVFRGPQGTLFGKNTTGGVVSITTRRPEHGVWSGDFSYTHGRYDGGSDGEIQKAKFALNIPVIEETLSLRVSGIFDYDDGPYENDKDTATFPEFIPLYAAFGLPAVNPPMPPELDVSTQGGGEDLNGKDVLAGRGKLLWNPTDWYEAYFVYEVVRDRSDAPISVNETPQGEGFLQELLGFPGIQQAGWGDVFSVGMTAQNNGIQMHRGHRVDVDGYYLTQTFQLSEIFGLRGLEIMSITGYREQEEVLPSTYTGEAFNNLFDASRNLEREMLQQELRLVSSFDGPFNFVLGGNFFRDDFDFRAYATVGLLSLLPEFNPGTGSFLDARGFVNLDLDVINDPVGTASFQDRRSWAIFFDGSYDLSEQLRFSAGIRFTRDAKEFERWNNAGAPCNAFTPPKDQVLIGGQCVDARSNAVSRAGITGNHVSDTRLPFGAEQFGTVVDTSEAWTRWTWRAALDYRFTDEMMGYLSYSTGFLSGGFTETCSSLGTCVPYEEETNYSVEVGIKADLLDNRLRANVAGFYGKYKDLQRNQVVPFTDPFGNTTQETITLNAGRSEVWGVEFESTWFPTSDLRFDLSVGFLDHEYEVFDVDLDGDLILDDGTHLDVPYSGHLQVNLAASYDWLTDFGRINFNGVYNYRSEGEYTPFNSPDTQMEARSLLGLAVTYNDPRERYRVTLWGRNLLDEEHRVHGNQVAGLWTHTLYGPPRSFGIEVGYSF